VCDQDLQIATLRALAAVLVSGVDETDPVLQETWKAVAISGERTHGQMSSVASILRF